ncbi:MAG: hypothetical protein KAS62_06575, partial [Candidatus Delongbacteria bacterium]|nr:hypothetical protein [Candidatus Delongbacteria bacterium]
LCWYNKTPSHSTGNLWAADQTTVNGIIPYEGNYSAYVSGESLHECWCNDWTGLRTPTLDLSSYDNVTLSYYVNLYHDKYDSDMKTSVFVKIFDNSIVDSSYCIIDDVYYTHPDVHWLQVTNIERATNGEWQYISTPINFNFESCFINFYAEIQYYDDSTYIPPEEASVMLDAVSIAGTITLESPSNVLIDRNTTTTTISWDIVPGATEYKVYASEDPYGTFVLDTAGTWNSSTEWQKDTADDKYFYYIIAASSTKQIFGKSIESRGK